MPDQTIITPRQSTVVYSWTAANIIVSRDAQIRGDMATSARLGVAMRSEPAIYAALAQRLAPVRGLPRHIAGGNSRVRADATRLLDALPTTTVAEMMASLAVHGIAVAQAIWVPRADGSRVDGYLDPWPAEALQYDEATRTLWAWTDRSERIAVVPGDGRWVVACLADGPSKRWIEGEDGWSWGPHRPWQWGALIPLASCWMTRGFARANASDSARAHGQPRPIGTMAEGAKTDDASGAAFRSAVENLADKDSGAIIPYGYKIELLEATGGNWQIFSELIKGETGDIGRVLLGQDSTIQASGGDYRKSQYLWGVRQDIVEGDIAALADALTHQWLRPWARYNWGRYQDLTVAWQFPDPDEDARRASYLERVAGLATAVESYRKAGLEVTQELIDTIATELGIEGGLLAAAQQTAQLQLSVTDLPAIVTVDEGRTSVGLSAIGDARTIARARADAETTAPVPVP